MIKNKQIFKPNAKRIILHLTSYDNVFPKNLKELIKLYMKAHNIIEVTLNYEENIAEYLEKYPKNISVFMWLNGDISSEEFKKHLKYNVEGTVQGLEDFLENVEYWFNFGRFRSG